MGVTSWQRQLSCELYPIWHTSSVEVHVLYRLSEGLSERDMLAGKRGDWKWQKGRPEANVPAVFRQPLSLHSTRPLTGFMRTGYCEAPQADRGNHSVAGPSSFPISLSNPSLPYIPLSLHATSSHPLYSRPTSHRNQRIPRLQRRTRQRSPASRPH